MEKLEIFTLSHWGLEIKTHQAWLLESHALNQLESYLYEACAEIERWDLKVGRAEIDFLPSDQNDNIYLEMNLLI